MYVQQQDFKEGAQENKDQPNLGTNGRERYKCNYRAISRKAINYVSNGAEEPTTSKVNNKNPATLRARF